MPNGLSPKNVIKKTLEPISGVVTDEAITEDFGLSAGGSKNLRIDLEVSGVTVVGSISAIIQDRSPGGSFSALTGANATVAITAAGTFSITQNIEVAADQPNMPIRKMCRVVLTTTNAGDAITVDKVYVQQEL